MVTTSRTQWRALSRRTVVIRSLACAEEPQHRLPQLKKLPPIAKSAKATETNPRPNTTVACAALANARTALYSMINAKDKSAQDALNAKVQDASTKLDRPCQHAGADAKAAADFKALWDQFKTTRDNQIIPAIYKGNADEAKKIADGIQSERLSKMWSIMSCVMR